MSIILNKIQFHWCGDSSFSSLLDEIVGESGVLDFSKIIHVSTFGVNNPNYCLTHWGTPTNAFKDVGNFSCRIDEDEKSIEFLTVSSPPTNVLKALNNKYLFRCYFASNTSLTERMNDLHIPHVWSGYFVANNDGLCVRNFYGEEALRNAIELWRVTEEWDYHNHRFMLTDEVFSMSAQINNVLYKHLNKDIIILGENHEG